MTRRIISGPLGGCREPASHRTQYDFADARTAELSYHRLRQVGRDGTTSFSPTISGRAAAE